MKLIDREQVDGTEVTIGRRVIATVEHGVRTESEIRTYTAIYKDVDSKWKPDALGTTNRREARRKAIEIQQRVEAGKSKPAPTVVALVPLIDQYETFCADKGLTPRSLAKYKADLDKLRRFATVHKVTTLAQFNPQAFYRYRTWLGESKHKQGVVYAPKSIYAALTVAKQVAKWAHRQGLCSEYFLASVELPTAKARPQPCFTTAQVETVLKAATDADRIAFAILAYSGMRIGELEQLQWADVLLDRGELGLFHIRRGGSVGVTKDKDERFVPIHPRVRPFIDALPRIGELVLPHIAERQLLASLKRTCGECGLSRTFKLHSFRHHFASLCANHHVAYRKALAWLGHSSSDILDLYYHLHDEESEAAMKALAEGWNRGSR
jgi:integrase